jgi:hypothetical protein
MMVASGSRRVRAHVSAPVDAICRYGPVTLHG